MAFGDINVCKEATENAILKLIQIDPESVNNEEKDNQEREYRVAIANLNNCLGENSKCNFNPKKTHAFVTKLFDAGYMPSVCTISREQKVTNCNPCELVTSAIDIIARLSYKNCDLIFFDLFMSRLDFTNPDKIWDVIERPFEYMDATYLDPAIENPEAGTAVILIYHLMGKLAADKFIKYLEYKAE